MTEQAKVKTMPVEALEKILKTISPVFRFDLDSVLENTPNYKTVGIPVDTDLSNEHVLELSYCEMYEFDTPITPSMLSQFANAYQDGFLTDRRILRCQGVSYYLVEPLNSSAMELAMGPGLTSEKPVTTNVVLGTKSYQLSLHRGLTPFAFGLLKAGGLHKEFVPCCQDDTLVVRIWHPKDADPDSVDRVVNHYLFELAASSNILLHATSYWIADSDEEDPEVGSTDLAEEGTEDTPQMPSFSLEIGPGAHEVCSLWLRGKQSQDPASQLNIYTRVIEYVSATVMRLEAHSHLRQLLRSQESQKLRSSFLDKLLAQTEKYHRSNKRDLERLRATVCHCCSPVCLADAFGETMPRLAEGLRSEKQSEIDKAMAEFARVLSATRNSLVHAKTNYEATGSEVAESELRQFLPAVEFAALASIQWFTEQAHHVRAV